MQAEKSMAKEQAVSTQLRRELCNANQQLSRVCCTLPPCVTFVTTVVLLNGKRCPVTAAVSVQSHCRTVKDRTQTTHCCSFDQREPWCVFQGPGSPAVQCSTGM